MPVVIKLEISEVEATPMRQAAEREGKSLEDWAVTLLRRCAPKPSDLSEAVSRLLKHTVDAPLAIGADNVAIDDDLAREYASTHEGG